MHLCNGISFDHLSNQGFDLCAGHGSTVYQTFFSANKCRCIIIWEGITLHIIQDVITKPFGRLKGELFPDWSAHPSTSTVQASEKVRTHTYYYMVSIQPPDTPWQIHEYFLCCVLRMWCFSSPRVVTALLVLLRCCYWNTLMIPICTSSLMYHLLSQIWFMLTAVVVISHSCSPQLLNDTYTHKRVHTLEHTFSLCKLETWPNLSKLQLVECC